MADESKAMSPELAAALRVAFRDPAHLTESQKNIVEKHFTDHPPTLEYAIYKPEHLLPRLQEVKGVVCDGNAVCSRQYTFHELQQRARAHGDVIDG